MILHLLPDDRFSDYVVNQFLRATSNSTFLVVLLDSDNLKHIENKDKISVAIYNSEYYKHILADLSKFNAIIVHGFFYSWQEEIVLVAPKETKVTWVFWGGEIYGRSDLRMNYLSNKSKILFYLRKFKKGLFDFHKQLEMYFVDKNTFNRIDYCLTDVHEEYEFIKLYSKSSMKELWYNYYSIEETVGVLKDKHIKGNNILVGNSSTLENNHLDAFKKLIKFELRDRKVITPLSYGQKWLMRFVYKKGKRTFKTSFFPLMNFISLEEYNDILLTCSVVIMNHYRPQAMGNLLTALWMGAKVYMSKRSCLYDYFKRLDIIVFSIEDELKPSNKEALTLLSDESVEHNRLILMQEYGRDNMMIKIRELINVLNN